MKKVFALVLSAILVMSFVACGQSNSGSPSESAAASVSSAETTGENVGNDAGSESKKSGSNYSATFLCIALGDMSFADSGKRGLDRLAADYGFDTKAVEAGVDSSKYDSYVIDICESGTNFLLATGEFQENIEKIASDYPDMRFVICDVNPNTEVKSDNILYISYAQNEGSYLVGMVAAAISESGVIGAVGGVQNPIIYDFITGYVEGAKAYNPNIKVITSWVGNWTDSAKMLELCTQQNSSYKTDVFFPIAGGAGLGAFEAALKLPSAWSIGVDSDQYAIFAAENNAYADKIVTSMLKQVDNSFVKVFGDFLDGNEYWGTVRILGVKEGGVDYVNNEMLKKSVPDDVIAAVEKAKNDIVSGSIVVKGYKDFASEEEYNAYINEVMP